MAEIVTLPLHTLIRHAISGIVTILLFVIFPIAVMRPESLKDIFAIGGVIGLGILSIVLGFLWDAMKLYRFTIGYSKQRKAFVHKIANALSVPDKEALAYLAKASQIEREEHGGDLFLLHSKWVMSQVCAFLFVLAFVLWASTATWQAIAHTGEHIFILYLSSAVFLIFGLRLYTMAANEQQRIDIAWTVFCRDNAKTIRNEIEKPRRRKSTERNLLPASEHASGEGGKMEPPKAGLKISSEEDPEGRILVEI